MSVAVVGCGYWGSKHVRVLHAVSEVERIAAVDASQERLDDLAQAFPRLGCFSSLDDALDHVDAVVIATPPRTHAPLALQAIDAGKGVLIEKPFAMSTVDAALMAEAAEDRGVTLMAGHTFEYNPAVWKLRELIESGELGDIYYLDSARLNLGLYQSDVNVLWDLAPHDVSIFNHILDATPYSVEAWGSTHAHRSLEDVVYVRLQYPDAGVTANVHVSWLDPCKVRRVTVVGGNKMAVYNDLAADERVRIFDKGVVAPEVVGEHLQNIPMSYRYGDIRSPHIDGREPLAIQDQHFVDCVVGGTPPRTSAQNGFAVVQALEAAEISLRESRPVLLDEVGYAAAQRHAELV